MLFQPASARISVASTCTTSPFRDVRLRLAHQTAVMHKPEQEPGRRAPGPDRREPAAPEDRRRTVQVGRAALTSASRDLTNSRNNIRYHEPQNEGLLNSLILSSFWLVVRCVRMQLCEMMKRSGVARSDAWSCTRGIRHHRPSPALAKVGDGSRIAQPRYRRSSSGVRLSLDSKRKSASPETRERPRTVQGQTAVETGSGKPVGRRGASERARAIWTRSAHLHAGRRKPSMRRADRPDTRKRMTRRLELDKEKFRVAGATNERPDSKQRVLPYALGFNIGLCQERNETRKTQRVIRNGHVYHSRALKKAAIKIAAAFEIWF